jgi:hypothetical protein
MNHARYLVLLHRSDDDLNPDIYYTDDEQDAHTVGESAEYHSYTLITVEKAEHYANSEEE